MTIWNTVWYSDVKRKIYYAGTKNQIRVLDW